MFGHPASGTRRDAWFVSAPEVPTFGCSCRKDSSLEQWGGSFLFALLVEGNRAWQRFTRKATIHKKMCHGEKLPGFYFACSCAWNAASDFQGIRTPACWTTALRFWPNTLSKLSRGNLTPWPDGGGSTNATSCQLLSRHRCRSMCRDASGLSLAVGR